MKPVKTTAASMACVAALCLTAGIGAAAAQNAPAEDPSKVPGMCSVDGTTKAGRRVHAYGDVTLGIQVEGELVTVKVGEPHFDANGKMSTHHTLRVEKERVVLDGKTQAKIPPAATLFQVTCTKSRLSVMADKRSVFVLTLRR